MSDKLNPTNPTSPSPQWPPYQFISPTWEPPMQDEKAPAHSTQLAGGIGTWTDEKERLYGNPPHPPQSTRCEHDWQVEGINLRRDSTGVIECSKCAARQEDVVLTDDQIWRFIGDHVIG